MAFVSQNLNMRLAICVGILSISCFAHPPWHEGHGKRHCGYEGCPNVNPYQINVHLVPHTHNDVGGKRTMDQYYYGSDKNFKKGGVQYILDSVMDHLQSDPTRRFTYVETAFFWKWWLEQNSYTRQIVKHLVTEGKLEFVGGAWSMNDEATVYYQAIIDQFTWGLRKLNDTFGECGRPRSAWQIDSYGHSREMASMLARMGYDGLFFFNLDFEDKKKRLSEKNMEMIWKSSDNLGEETDLFTSILFHEFNTSQSLCFDILCGADPIIDDVRNPAYNMETKINEFISAVHRQVSFYNTNNILFPIGGDFHYQGSSKNFVNMDKLIKYANAADARINVFYSTPSCYLKAVNDDDKNLSSKYDDFFPFATNPVSYWTGFYTSRPTLKYFERLGNNFLQIAKQLVAMTKLEQRKDSEIDMLREAMGIMQHHEAITGTEKQHVAQDYAKTLTLAIENARGAVNSALNHLISKKGIKLEMQNCLQLNASLCDVTENNDEFMVTVYNPLSHSVTHYVRFPVPSGKFLVHDNRGITQSTQMIPLPQHVIEMPERRGSNITHELVFKAKSIPPLGYRCYYVFRVVPDFPGVNSSEDTFIGNRLLKVILDDSTGLVKSVVKEGIEIPIEQNLYYYEAAQSSKEASDQYIFQPNGILRPITETVSTVVYKGEVVEEIHQTFSDWASQVIRLYKGEKYIEFEWLIGPIPDEDNIGKEVISLFKSNFETNGFFYTDSNGREMIQRRRDYRPTWNVTLNKAPISGNYYPVSTMISIKDEVQGQELVVLNDRAQGGSSLRDGQLELLIHRNLLYDRQKVGETLNEKAYGKGLVVRGRHFLLIGNKKFKKENLAFEKRELSKRILLSPWPFFTPGSTALEKLRAKLNMEYSGIHEKLPANVHILTLEPWKENSLLLRLERILEKGEDLEQPEILKFKIKELFSSFKIYNAEETTLAANQWLKDKRRLIWRESNKVKRAQRSLKSVIPPVEMSLLNKKFESEFTKFDRGSFSRILGHDIPTHSTSNEAKTDAVTLEPMEIRTFVIEVKKRNFK